MDASLHTQQSFTSREKERDRDEYAEKPNIYTKLVCKYERNK